MTSLIMSGRLSRIGEWEQLARQADFQPARMAALCCIFYRQLERFFKLQFQKTPGRWLRALQCKLAKELISKGYSNDPCILPTSLSAPCHCIFNVLNQIKGSNKITAENLNDMVDCICAASSNPDCDRSAKKIINEIFNSK
jgi:AraC-like DNA-binding protein